jgi:hypothetical protein
MRWRLIPVVIDLQSCQVILGMNRSGFCIYIDTVFEGPVPSVTESLPADPAGAPGRGFFSVNLLE